MCAEDEFLLFGFRGGAKSFCPKSGKTRRIGNLETQVIMMTTVYIYIIDGNVLFTMTHSFIFVY